MTMAKCEARDRPVPKDEVREIGADIEVTEEMVKAGADYLWENDLPPSVEGMPVLVVRMYRLM
jgi:hypothetical protein